MMKVMKVASVAVAALVGVSASVAWAGCGTCPGDNHGKAKAEVKAAGGACADGSCAVGAKEKAKQCSKPSSDGIVNTQGLDALLKAKTPLKIFDARSGKYDDGKRIPGATQLSADADEAVIAKAIPAKDTLVVTYCAGPKCPASKALHDRLKKLGYSNVLEYPQGIAGWLEAGKAVEDKK